MHTASMASPNTQGFPEISAMEFCASNAPRPSSAPLRIFAITSSILRA